jgi:putative transposase
MPYHQLFYHIVWSTYERLPLINDHNRSAIHKAIIDKVQRLGGVVYAINSVGDHIHLVVSLPPTQALAACIGQLKGCSSHLAARLVQGAAPFRWQAEYGVISIGKGQLPQIVAYVERQQQRHGVAAKL